MILRRALIALALFCAAALLLSLFGLNWFGASLLRHYSQGQISAGSLSGPLWSPTAHDLTVNIKGVQVSAQRAQIRLSQVSPWSKSARVNVTLEEGSVNVQFKELLGKRSGKKSAGSGYHILPGQITVRQMRLNLDGKGANIPNATLQVSGEDGALKLQGKSDYGPLGGLLRYGEKAGQFWGRLDIDSDARIVNTYWPRSIQGGRVTGQYRFGGGKPIEGDLKVTGGVVVVPQAKFVQIRKVSGWAMQRGSAITGVLRGEMLGGPVQANVGVDTQAKNWQVKADAAPTFSGLGKSLGLPGSGEGRLKVTAGGWTTVNVKAQLASTQGSFASIPFGKLGADYSFQSSSRDRKTTINRNVLSLQADTTLLGEQQQLWGNWHFNKAGTLHWTGQLGAEALSLSDQIDAHNVMKIAGQGLGGPVQASLNLKTKTIDAALSPNAYGLTGQLAARGPLSDLALQAHRLKVGPLTLDGTGRLNKAGLQAKLKSAGGGQFVLATGRNWRGQWQAGGLKLLGATLDGSGDINLVSGLSGRMQAQLPAALSPQTLQGPIALNWKQKVGQWQAGGQRLTWRGNTLGLKASNLKVGGLVLGGQVNYQMVGAGKGVTGQLTATGRGVKVFATGQGQQVSLRGQAAGVQLDALSDIQSPYRTQVSLRGADIDGKLSYQEGLQFSLRTGQKFASGRIAGQQWAAAGDLDLGALRPVLATVLGQSAARYMAGLQGNVHLNLLGLGGTATVQARAQVGQLAGLFTRREGQWWANLQAQVPQGLNTRLSGQIYPQVALAGPVRWQGQQGQSLLPAQQLQARISGPYRALRLDLAGQTTALQLGSLSLPAQPLQLSGNITPRLALGGRWGELQAQYNGQALAVQGQQRLSVAGRTGLVKLSGNWRPDFSGSLNAAGTLGEYQVAASGPWKALNVQLSGAGLQAAGRVNAQNQAYQAQVSGQLAGLQLRGQVQGVRAKLTGQLRASDGQGGWADMQLHSLQSFALQAHALKVAGQTLRGNLFTQGGQLSGSASLGPLSLRATRGHFEASGVYAQHRVQATGRLALPGTLTGLDLQVDGPYLRAQATGSTQDLRGSVLVKAQRFSRSGVEAQLPAQLLPLQASLSPLRANLGGLEYTGAWRGRTRLRYLLNGQAGLVALRGDGQALTALPSGAVGGQVQLLPQFGGAVQADLNLLTPLLPAQARSALEAGKLQATLSRTGATFATRGSRWQGQPLQVSGQLGWQGQGGPNLSALLTQGRSRVPVTLRGRHLQVRQATLDAWALRPFVRPFVKLNQPLSGQLSGHLDMPDLSVAGAQGDLRVNLQAGAQAARGQLHLAQGQLGGDLASDLGGQTLQVSGPLYPRAQARVVYGGLQGSIEGDARQQGKGRWLARVGGVYSGKAVDATASITPSLVNLTALVAGARVQLSAAPQQRTWAVQGRFSAPDLRPLAGQTGSLSGTLGGTLNDLSAQVGGVVAGSTVSLPARYQHGVLSVTAAQALTPVGSGEQSGHARTLVSGQVWPRLNLSGTATLDTLAPGHYALSASGSFGRPLLSASGTLTHDLQGFGVAGTRLRAVLSGKDFRVQAQGAAFSGEARGRTDFAGYLQRFALRLNTPYRSGKNALQLRGPVGWTAGTGWNGGLNVNGEWSGQALSAQLQGRGVLGLEARYGPAAVSGELGSFIWQKPTGTLRLSRLDVGRLWGRPDQLNLTGTARLSGASWKSLQAAFTGRVQDVGAGDLSGGDLSGNLWASYAPTGTTFGLQGQRLQAGGQWQDDALSARIDSRGVELARLLPPKWQVGALKMVGSLEASASLKGGLQRLEARNLYLSGQQERLGQFKLLGQANYQPAQAQGRADLTGYALGGHLTARGDLPTGLDITAENLNLALLGSGMSAAPSTSSTSTPQTPTAQTPTAQTPIPLSAQLHLLGDPKNPALSGTLQLTRPEALVQGQVSGRVQDPHLHLKAGLQGQYAGTLYADLSALDLSKQQAQLHLYGAAQQGQNRAALDMQGVWPNLSGQLTASLAGVGQPVVLTGQGNGHYALGAGDLGSGQLTLMGFNPQVSGEATLRPLPLLGATGTGEVALTVSGPVSNLQLSGAGKLVNVQRSGVTLPETTLSLGGIPAALTGQLQQNGQEVATLQGRSLKLSGLQLSALGSRLNVTGSGDLAKGQLSAQLQASGNLTGQASLKYSAGALTAGGDLSGAGFAGQFAARANRLTGWSGNLNLSGGPRVQGLGQVLSSPLNLQLSGPYQHPRAAGRLGLGGAQGNFVASETGLQLRLQNGPLTRASGLLSLQQQSGRYLWKGQAHLARRKGQLDVALSGEAASPQAQVKVVRGQWYAGGVVGTQAARLAFGDGKATGTLRWDGQHLDLSSQSLDLARLDIPGLSGQVQPQASLEGRTGQAGLVLNQVVSGASLPYLGIPLQGSGKLSAGLNAGAISAAGKLNLSAGALSFSAAQAQPGGLWQGELQSDLRQDGGRLQADLAIHNSQASGSLRAEALPVKLGALQAKVQGQVDLRGQQFNSNLQLSAAAGTLTLGGGGGLANLLPSLSGLTGIKPLDQGYQLQAQLAGFDLGQLGVGGVKGNVNGQLLLGEGSGTFVVRSGSLQLGGSTLGTRIDGTLAGGDWRLRGHIGDSALFGAVTGGNLSARMQLQALPVGSVITALTGKEVGEGLVTGVARIEAPLSDPLSGAATVVAERVKVTAGQDTLMGQGSLNFAGRELTGLNLQMQGAGTWDVHGQYTRQKVDLTAAFKDTTFTPVLALIPSLADQATLKGSLNLQVAGRYEQPTATLTGRDLQGSLAGIQAQVPRLDASLSSSGSLSAQAGVTAAGTVGGSGQLSLTGTFASSQLSGVQLGYQGSLSADALGDLGQAGLRLWQAQDKTWQVEAAATHGGTLRASGQLAPTINLALSAQEYNLPIRTIYARESSLNGALKAVAEGDSATGNVVVSGNLNFARLLLGRVNAAAPLPGTSQDKAGNKASTFVSPLPNELTTFAQPESDKDAAGRAKKAAPIFLKRVVFDDIPVRAPGNVRVDESLAQAELSADLTLSGTGDNPLLSGDVHNLRGTLTLRDNEFSVQNAVATFDGSSLYPVFSLTAQGQVPDSEGKRIGVQLQADGNFGVQQGGSSAGRALQLHTALTCTTCAAGSEYSEAELYSLLALGTPDITAVGSTSNLTSLGTSAVSTALNVFVLGELQRNIAKALGVDVFRINSNLINADGSVDAHFTVGTYLSKQFYVQYQVDLTGAGLIDATYTTDDGRLTFKASTPLSGLNLESIRPSFSAIYNLGTRHSLSLGVQSGKSTKFSAGYVFKY